MFLENLAFFMEILRFQHAFSIQKAVKTPYMDEIFHVKQMQTYCKGDYLRWDDKITTPPGMYGIHLGILWIANKVAVGCDLMSLRTLNVITDVFSTLLVFLSLYLTLEKRHKTSAMVSFLSLTIRQTNVVWVLFLISISIFPPHIFHEKLQAANLSVWNPSARNANFFGRENNYLRFIKSLSRFLIEQYMYIIKIIWPYVIIVFLFGIFVIYNKGIALGDKANHTVGIHLLQLFYFSVFTAFWGSPHLLTKNMILHFFKQSFGNRWAWFRTCGIMIIMGLIVHFNTKEHPFLISDNRHYVFYIWRKTIKVHPAAKYVAVPFYYASAWAILNKLIFYQKISYILSFIVAIILVLVPVSLLEFRYFIVPYLLWRFSIQSTHKLRLYAEALLFLCINYITVNIFLYKPFFWESEPKNLQRFMW
ncbi:hypothetical protein PORY_000509 [Pneumocystis oryctolagi]|uniref:Uncharacterized protein n=1 Tax=Pneumocystis oryctolagi TaxID=42067 RepID=A0ACB7CFX9_9ASCO|nr:hypothetical protein PORY_000509 [Pneumocystis oryctolagi]